MKNVTIQVEDDVIALLKSGDMKIALLPKDELENVEGGLAAYLVTTSLLGSSQEGDQ